MNLRFVVCVSLALMFASPALAETIVLNGMGEHATPMQLTLQEGTALTSCGGRENRIMRCVFVESSREAEVMADFASQLIGAGWVSREPGPGAAPGLQIFVRPDDRERCPNQVMIIPRSTPRGAAPAPEGQVYFTIGYAPDMQCLLGRSN